MITHTKGNITRFAADVIVNAANTELSHKGGVARAIAHAAGAALIKESEEKGICPLGEFVVTTAGNLHAKKVIHVPTIDYTRGGRTISYEDLESAWVSVLDYCRKEGYKDIATPLLGTGVVGLDKEKVDEILSRQAMKAPGIDVIIVEK